jgi:hypothetical protein
MVGEVGLRTVAAVGRLAGVAVGRHTGVAGHRTAREEPHTAQEEPRTAAEVEELHTEAGHSAPAEGYPAAGELGSPRGQHRQSRQRALPEVRVLEAAQEVHRSTVHRPLETLPEARTRTGSQREPRLLVPAVPGQEAGQVDAHRVAVRKHCRGSQQVAPRSASALDQRRAYLLHSQSTEMQRSGRTEAGEYHRAVELRIHLAAGEGRSLVLRSSGDKKEEEPRTLAGHLAAGLEAAFLERQEAKQPETRKQTDRKDSTLWWNRGTMDLLLFKTFLVGYSSTTTSKSFAMWIDDAELVTSSS